MEGLAPSAQPEFCFQDTFFLEIYNGSNMVITVLNHGCNFPLETNSLSKTNDFFFTTNLFQGGSKPYIILFHPLFIPSCIYKKDPCWLRKTKTSPTKPLPKSKHTYTQLSFACNMWSLYIYENILHMGDKLHVLLLFYS